MNPIAEHFRHNVSTTVRDFIKDVSPIAHKSPEETEELIAAAQKSIDTAIELLEEWKNLGGKRAYGLSYGRSSIMEQPDNDPWYQQYMGLDLYFHLWPFGTNQNDVKTPKSVNHGAYFRPHCLGVEHFNAIVNDTLESIKKAEELINPATKED